MTASPLTLESIKQDGPALFALLGIQRPGSHRCPFHDDSVASLSVSQSESGTWLWKCFAGCGQGTIVDALALIERFSPEQAIQRLTSSTYTPPEVPCRRAAPATPTECNLPVPNPALVYRLFSPAFEAVIEGRAADALKRRGIHSTAWFAINPILGFVELLDVPGWKYPLINSWLILVTDSRWNYLAVKVHREKPHAGPKSLWLPVGTEPQDKPRHGAATFWPPPECFDSHEPIFIFEGELKAAAAIADGVAATAPTDGAGHKWTPGQLERFRNRRVVILYDDDPAGHKFKESTAAALQHIAAELKADTLGQRDAA